MNVRNTNNFTLKDLLLIFEISGQRSLDNTTNVCFTLKTMM